MAGSLTFRGGVALLVEVNIQNAPVQLGPAALCGYSGDGKRIRAGVQVQSWNEKRKCLLAVSCRGHLDRLSPELFSLRILESERKGSVGRRVRDVDEKDGSGFGVGHDRQR